MTAITDEFSSKIIERPALYLSYRNNFLNQLDKKGVGVFLHTA